MEIKLYVGTNRKGVHIRTAVWDGRITFVDWESDVKRLRNEGLEKFFKAHNLKDELERLEYYDTYSSVEELISAVELLILLEN